MPPRDDKVDAWMPLYVRDILAATQGLTATQFGAYALLLCHLWLEHGYLDDDQEQLRKLARMSRRGWPAVWKRLTKYFTATSDGRIFQKRLLHELEQARALRQARSEAGRKGAAAAHGQNDAAKDGNASVLPVANPGSHLTSPSPAPSSAPGSGSRARSRAPHPLFDWALAVFRAGWLRTYGADYVPTHADRSHLGRLLHDAPRDLISSTLPACLDRYFADKSPFVAQEKRHSLAWFVHDGGLNRYRTTAPAVSAKEARTAQALTQFLEAE